MSFNSPQDINKQVDKTNDPSYLGYSRGTDNASLQQLSNVPELNTKYVQPDYKANTTYGKLFEGLGTVGTDAVKLSDDIIKNNIDKDITKGVSAIRDSFGVAAAAENADLARTVGKAGAEGAPTDLSGGRGGGPLMPQDQNLPLPIQRLGTRLEGLKEQYAQGDLSNSAYYAKQEAFVRETKARYPGYEDEVDKVVEKKLGVNPANATRAAIQQDVEKLANKVSAQNDKWTTWERQNASTIARVYGGDYSSYQADVAAGKITKPQIEAKVANFDAKEADDKSKMAAIAMAGADRTMQGSQAKDQTTIGMTRIVDDAVGNTIKAFNIPDLGAAMDSVRSGKVPLLSPDDKIKTAASLSLLNQKVDQAMNEYLDKPILDAAGHTATRRSLIGDNAQIEAIKTGATGNLKQLTKLVLGREEPSLFQYDATLATARREAATNNIINQVPSLLASSVFKEYGGDDLAAHLLLNSKTYSNSVVDGVSKLNWGRIAQGGYSIHKVFDDAKRDGINDGDLNRDMIEHTKEIIQHPELARNKIMQPNAVEHLFGPDNMALTEQVMAASGPKAAAGFFSSVTDEKTIRAVNKMDDKHKTMVTTWAESAFPGIYQTQAQTAEQYAKANTEQNSLSLNFDPKGGKFYYTGQFMSAQPIVNRANSQLDSFNAAIQSMKRVWDMNGETDIVNKLYQYLPVAGIEPGTKIYSLIQKEYNKAAEKTPQ